MVINRIKRRFQDPKILDHRGQDIILMALIEREKFKAALTLLLDIDMEFRRPTVVDEFIRTAPAELTGKLLGRIYKDGLRYLTAQVELKTVVDTRILRWMLDAGTMCQSISIAEACKTVRALGEHRGLPDEISKKLNELEPTLPQSFPKANPWRHRGSLLELLQGITTPTLQC